MFLTEDEVAELTGCYTTTMQRRWLDEYEIPHHISSKGRVILSRVIAEERKKYAVGLRPPVPTDSEIFRNCRRIPNRMVGVYLLMKGSKVIYIGKTESFFVRMAPHAAKKDFDEVIFVPVDPTMLNDMESELIARYRPPLNVFKVKRRFSEKPTIRVEETA